MSHGPSHLPVRIPSEIPTPRDAGVEAISDHYAAQAKGYDQRWAEYVDRSTEATLAFVDVVSIRRVLDVGCGTGVALGKLAKRISPERLVGVDISPEMLKVARNRLPANVECFVADARQLPFDDREFDAVLSTSSLHHWHDVRACLEELVRVCRPGGQVILTDWSRDYWTMWWEHCRHRVKRWHARVYTRSELQKLMTDSGLVDIAHRPVRINWYWRLMTLAARRPAESKDATPDMCKTTSGGGRTGS